MSLLHGLRTRRRLVDVALLLFSLALLAYALYLQYYRGLQPCPLCIFQRVAVIGLAAGFGLAALVPDGWRKLRASVSGLIALVAAAGVYLSGRHLYIQSLPPGEVPSCGATLDYMWDVFPAGEVIRKVLTGSGECAKVDWSFLGLAMPAWVLICIVILGTLGVLTNWPERRAP